MHSNVGFICYVGDSRLGTFGYPSPQPEPGPNFIEAPKLKLRDCAPTRSPNYIGQWVRTCGLILGLGPAQVAPQSGAGYVSIIVPNSIIKWRNLWKLPLLRRIVLVLKATSERAALGCAMFF